MKFLRSSLLLKKEILVTFLISLFFVFSSHAAKRGRQDDPVVFNKKHKQRDAKECPACTYLNVENSLICPICETVLGLECSACTCVNTLDVEECVACGNALESKEPVPANVNVCNVCTFSENPPGAPMCTICTSPFGDEVKVDVGVAPMPAIPAKKEKTVFKPGIRANLKKLELSAAEKDLHDNFDAKIEATRKDIKAHPAKYFPKVGFFQASMGMSEAQFLGEIKKTKKIPAIPAHYNLGQLSCRTIAEYDQDIEAIKKAKGLLGGNDGTINVIAGTIWKGTNAFGSPCSVFERRWFRPFIDVTALQADPHNKGALFQVASNFNGLESFTVQKEAREGSLDIEVRNYFLPKLDGDLYRFVCKQSNVDPANLIVPHGGIESYALHAVQGEQAVINLAPSLTHRTFHENNVYQDPHDDKLPWANTLGNLPAFPVNTGGKLSVHDIDKVVLKGLDYKQAKVLFLQDAQVTGGMQNVLFTEGGRGKEELRPFLIHEKVEDPTQVVSQVFSAAINFKSVNGPQNAHHGAAAYFILNAQFEGLFKAACIHGKKNVFVTLVGAGDFKNPPRLVLKAILAHKDFIKAAGLQVTIVVYAYDDQIDENLALLEAIEETGGTFSLYAQDGKYGLDFRQK